MNATTLSLVGPARWASRWLTVPRPCGCSGLDSQHAGATGRCFGCSLKRFETPARRLVECPQGRPCPGPAGGMQQDVRRRRAQSNSRNWKHRAAKPTPEARPDMKKMEVRFTRSPNDSMLVGTLAEDRDRLLPVRAGFLATGPEPLTLSPAV